MKRVRLELELLTPAFLGGADQARAEWRAASVRGQLRWWLRAVAGGRHGDARERLAAVREIESAVFGSSARGRSPVQVRLLPKGRSPTGSSDKTYRQVAYLAYGCVDPRSGAPTRGVIEEGEKATLQLQWPRRTLGEPQEKALLQAVWAWTHLGGLGSRSRNGFGSMAVSDDKGWLGDVDAASPEAFGQALTRRLGTGGAAVDPPEWTHLTPASRILVSAPGKRTGLQALQQAANLLKSLRHRYGAHDDTRTLAGMPLQDRDLVWVQHRRSEYHQQAPDCGGFGLPLPYHSPDGSIRDDEILTWGPPDRGDGRRASPLHLHVLRLGRQYHTVWTHLPARFLPEGETLRFKNDLGGHLPVTPEQERIVGWTLDRFVGEGHLQEVWP
jgi:CRISPR-associated protein Cmr1